MIKIMAAMFILHVDVLPSAKKWSCIRSMLNNVDLACFEISIT